MLLKILSIPYMIYYDLNKYFNVEEQRKIDKQVFPKKNYFFLD